jgi:hypothetical protein
VISLVSKFAFKCNLRRYNSGPTSELHTYATECLGVLRCDSHSWVERSEFAGEYESEFAGEYSLEEAARSLRGEAARSLCEAAKRGDAKAQLAMGFRPHGLLTFSEDWFTWMLQAEQQGDSDACFALGLTLVIGDLEQQTHHGQPVHHPHPAPAREDSRLPEAKLWLTKSAFEHRSAEALQLLGMIDCWQHGMFGNAGQQTAAGSGEDKSDRFPFQRHFEKLLEEDPAAIVASNLGAEEIYNIAAGGMALSLLEDGADLDTPYAHFATTKWRDYMYQSAARKSRGDIRAVFSGEWSKLSDAEKAAFTSPPSFAGAAAKPSTDDTQAEPASTAASAPDSNAAAGEKLSAFCLSCLQRLGNDAIEWVNGAFSGDIIDAVKAAAERGDAKAQNAVGFLCIKGVVGQHNG